MKRTIVAAFMSCLATAVTAGNSTVEWRSWSADAFGEAQRDHRFVILDLEAVWCHWCHVMEETTYRDPKVVTSLKKHYVAIRVDQDANPDLSARYGDWGWPATIIFSADGRELVKRRGYIEPENMAALLEAVVADPTPGPSVADATLVTPSRSSTLSETASAKLSSNFNEFYDSAKGGWGTVHKYIDPDSMDWALSLAERGDTSAMRMVRQTLDAATALIDPVWGGLYQYSDKDDWSSPHYEKIMLYQANGLRQYATAAALFKEPRYERSATAVYRYLTTKLTSPDGAFYATQDADVDNTIHGKEFYGLDFDQRAKLGREPRIAPGLYARENGWAITALVAYHALTGEAEPLERAKRAANWVLGNRRGANGMFKHGDNDRGGPYLGDQVAMGNAALDLYAATGGRSWLDVAQGALTSLQAFRDEAGGFVTTLAPEADIGVLKTSHTALDEQAPAARFAVRAWRYLGRSDAKALAEHGMRYLASDEVVEMGRTSASTLLTDFELSREPTHITVVGNKDDREAQQLHLAALQYPATNKRIDWWDKREGPLPNPDITYPDMDRAAAFACGDKLCSLPAFTTNALAEVVTQLALRDAADPAR